MRSTRLAACALALTAVLALPASAQDPRPGTTPGATGSTTSSTETMTPRNTDRGFDWGWLGLIGLAGLMGLRKQPDVMRTDTTRTPSPR